MLQKGTKGRSSPIGATVSREGTNFSVYSKHASSIELLLFDAAEDACPSRVIPIDPATNRTYHDWHVFVPGVKPGQIYACYSPKGGVGKTATAVNLGLDYLLIFGYGGFPEMRAMLGFAAAGRRDLGRALGAGRGGRSVTRGANGGIE